jgi:hypothetical protein
MKISSVAMVLLILSLVSSPVMAISKTDLLSPYRTDKPMTPSPEEVKSTTPSLLDLPDWMTGFLYPSLFNAWSVRGYRSSFEKPSPWSDVVHIILPDGRII